MFVVLLSLLPQHNQEGKWSSVMLWHCETENETFYLYYTFSTTAIKCENGIFQTF